MIPLSSANVFASGPIARTGAPSWGMTTEAVSNAGQ